MASQISLWSRKRVSNKTRSWPFSGFSLVSVKNKKMTYQSTKQCQMSLKESLKNQSLSKRLRPRRKKVNYCDDSRLLQQHLPSQHQDSIVVLKKIDSHDTRKVPVYKTIKTSELSSEDSDVYSFKYNTDEKNTDTKEKLAKKKKKRNIKTKSKRNTRKKVTVETKTVDNKKNKSNPDKELSVEIVRCKSLLEPATAAAPQLLSRTKEEVLEIIETPSVDTRVEITESTDKLSIDEIKKQGLKKPRIISIENANNITVTKAAPGSNKDILPFRSSSNIFNSKSTLQHKNVLNVSLIKSLSPISKEYDTFDPGSPWRPPQLPYVFSHAKHFVQSTPNVFKMDNIHKKHAMQLKDDSHSVDKVTSLSDTISKNANSLIQNISDHKVGYKKNSNLCRNFGTEITNLNNCSTIQGSNIEVISEKPAAEMESNSVTNVQLDTIAPLSSPNSLSPFDDMDDKENKAANYQTPKKKSRKKLKKQHSNSSPFKGYEIKSIAQNENVDPQPGPSGIKNSNNRDKQRVLRQSSLNNFLNIMDMPENTRVNTKHGIFDDVYSTPVNSSAIKKSIKPMTRELANAFGFCETDTDSSPTKSEFAANQALIKVQATCASKPITTSAPARLSLRELRNNLQKKLDKNAGNQQATKQKNVEVSKPHEVKRNTELVDVLNFSDTFDVLLESERLSNCKPTNVPSYMDLEPSHFSKPPQHSYKRKRAVTFNSLDDSSEKEEEEEEEYMKTLSKKKKLTKLERNNKEKRFKKWVKSLNNTFQEIDEYDLVIE